MSQLELFRDDYRLREKQSPKARSIRVEVRPGGDVVLVYPRFVPRMEALAFLRSREAWIRTKLAEMREREAARPRPPPPRWDGTDAVPLRGHLTPVSIAAATVRTLQARIEPDRITLFGPARLLSDRARLAQALRHALQHQARLDARRLLELEAPRIGVAPAALRVNDPQTLWGSCNPSGTICLSWRLVMAPPEVFRYVAIHELCHLVHRNHSARYWALVERHLPGHEAHKAWLREHGATLHFHLPRRG